MGQKIKTWSVKPFSLAICLHSYLNKGY
jgi:hypothetical protein